MCLEYLASGVHVTGLEPATVVTIGAVALVSSDAKTIYHKPPDDAVRDCMVSRADESGIDIAPVECLWAFDGDGQAFNLAVEAKRIEIAFLFDPMLAVHVGTVDRHQITAVYESMLPRLPLRYVLADDSGAVKTIAPKPPAD